MYLKHTEQEATKYIRGGMKRKMDMVNTAAKAAFAVTKLQEY